MTDNLLGGVGTSLSNFNNLLGGAGTSLSNFTGSPIFIIMVLFIFLIGFLYINDL